MGILDSGDAAFLTPMDRMDRILDWGLRWNPKSPFIPLIHAIPGLIGTGKLGHYRFGEQFH